MTIDYWWRSGNSLVTLKKGEDKEEYKFFHKLEKERYNRILGKIDTINGSIDLYTNGEQLYTQIQKSVIQETGDLEGKFLGFRSDYGVLFSNFIISD